MFCTNMVEIFYKLSLKAKVGSVEKGITIFNNTKRSKVNNEFFIYCLDNKTEFQQYSFQMLNFSHDNFLHSENLLLTFDLLVLLKTVIPFFHWAVHQRYTYSTEHNCEPSQQIFTDQNCTEESKR